jgi:PAS domain S-box-containing protein
MPSDREYLSKIGSLLKKHPRGLTISEISQQISVHRNSAAKYLEILQVSGRVEKRELGAAKIFFLTQRVPTSSLLNYSSEFVIVLNKRLEIIQVNDPILRFFGVEREALVGKAAARAPVPLIRDIAESGILEKVQADEKEIVSERESLLSEERYYFRVKCLPALFEDGQSGLTLLLEDISSRKKYEQDLVRSEARYRAIVEDQTELICRRSPDGTITFVNGAFSRFFGKEPGEVVGTKFQPRAWPPAEDNPDRQAPDPLPVLGGTSESHVMLDTNEIRWLQWNTSILYEGDGTVTEIQSVGRDISALRERERDILLNHCAIASSPYAVVLFDFTGKIIYTNRSFLSLFGCTNEMEVAGKPFELFVPRTDAEMNIHQVGPSVIRNEIFDHVMTARKRDGSPVRLQLYGMVLRNERYFPLNSGMFVCIDITGRSPGIPERKREKMPGPGAGMVVTDSSGTVLFADTNFIAITGRDDDSGIVGSPVTSLIQLAGDNPGDFCSVTGRCRETGSWTCEGEVTGSPGPSLAATITIRQVTGGEGRPLCYQVSAAPLPVRDRASLEQVGPVPPPGGMEDYFRTFTVPAYILDREKRIICWNRAMELMTGVRREEIAGSSDFGKAFASYPGLRPVLGELLDIPAEMVEEQYPDILRVTDDFYRERLIPSSRQQGRGAWISEKAARLVDPEGRYVGSMGIIQDVTEQKRTEKILLRMKEELEATLIEKVRQIEMRIGNV